MTLIVAGYEYAKSVDYSKYLDNEAEPSDPTMEIEGLYVVADSAITDANGKTLLNGFRKTYESMWNYGGQVFLLVAHSIVIPRYTKTIKYS